MSGYCLFIIAFMGCSYYENAKIATDISNKCKKLKYGMKYNEVYKIMGDPINIVIFVDNGIKKRRYYYISPKLASSYTHCVIDDKTEMLEIAYCGN